jgi:hypothetical protein
LMLKTWPLPGPREKQSIVPEGRTNMCEYVTEVMWRYGSDRGTEPNCARISLDS